MPTLVEDDGFALWESTAILRYLSAKKGGALVPATAHGVADMDKWMAWQLAHLGPAMSKVAFERIVKKLTGQGTADEAAIARNLVRQLVTYATGAPVRFSDRPAVEAILARTRAGGWGVRSLVHEVVQSELFRRK